MLSLNGVDICYGKTKAVSNVTLKVEQGQIATVLGANGAGKTTIINAISGLIPLTLSLIHL
jgi:branched-chain amino acid transport system ATP-binding protein